MRALIVVVLAVCFSSSFVSSASADGRKVIEAVLGGILLVDALSHHGDHQGSPCRPTYRPPQSYQRYDNYPSSCQSYQNYNPCAPTVVRILKIEFGQYTVVSVDHTTLQILCYGECVALATFPGAYAPLPICSVSADTVNGDIAMLRIHDVYSRSVYGLAVGDQLVIAPK